MVHTEDGPENSRDPRIGQFQQLLGQLGCYAHSTKVIPLPLTFGGPVCLELPCSPFFSGAPRGNGTHIAEIFDSAN